MKKPPLYYNNQIVGYIDDSIINDNIIQSLKVYLFYSEFSNYIIENIKKSIYSTLSENKYDIEFKDDYFICKIIK